MASKVLIVGGSGFIGKALQNSLRSRSVSFNLLSRDPSKGYAWNIAEKKIDMRAFENVDRVVYLAGASLADEKITEERKKELEQSRIDGSLFLREAMKDCKIEAFVGASAIGAYGVDILPDKVFKESDKSTTNDYGSQVLSC